jgi:hypothetical protein
MSEIRIETKAAGAGIISTTSTSAGTAYQFADGSEIHSINRGILKPLSGTIGVDTTYTIPTGEGTAFVIIPKAYLLATTTASVLLTITTGVDGKETVAIPIPGSGDTIISPSLMFNLYIDSTGNVYSDNFIVSGSNSNGSWIKFADGTMECWHRTTKTYAITTLLDGHYYNNDAWTLPAQFLSSTSYSAFAGARYSGKVLVVGVYPEIDTASMANFFLSANASCASGTVYLTYHAIGRWK